ncbi:MAG: hypothetical protein ACON4G_01725 [Candidatus Puniceispirillaceae bacterium]
MANIDLSDFLCHLGEATKYARHACARANIEALQDFLEKDEGEDIYRFRMLPIKIGDEVIEVPLFGLTPQGHLDLDSIEVDFDTVIGVAPQKVKQAFDESGAPLSDQTGNPKFSISLSKGLLSRSTEMKVKACFSLKDPSESAEQIRDKLNKLIP